VNKDLKSIIDCEIGLRVQPCVSAQRLGQSIAQDMPKIVYMLGGQHLGEESCCTEEVGSRDVVAAYSPYRG
jgi:hypothetical protein